jgi:hypothetical protein
VALAVVGMGLLAFGVWKLAVALRSDETRVRLALDAVVEAARERDAGALLEYVDPAYRDPQGHTYDSVRLHVLAALPIAQSVEAEIAPLSIEVEGDRALALVHARARARVKGQVVTLESAGLPGELFEVELRRHESYFRATSVRPAVRQAHRAPSEVEGSAEAEGGLEP